MKKHSKSIKKRFKKSSSFLKFSKRDSLFMAFGVLTIVTVGMYYVGSSKAGPAVPCPGFFCRYDTTNYLPKSGNWDAPTLRFDGWTYNGASGNNPASVPVGSTINVTMGYHSLNGTSQHILPWTDLPGADALLSNITATGGQDRLVFPDRCFNIVYDQNSPYYSGNWRTQPGGKVYCNTAFPLTAETGTDVTGGASVIWYMSSDTGSQLNRDTAFHFSATVNKAGRLCIRNHISVTSDPQVFQPGFPRTSGWMANFIRNVVGIAGVTPGSSGPLCLDFVNSPTPPPPLRSVDCHYIVVDAGQPAYRGRSFRLQFFNNNTGQTFDGPSGWNPSTTYVVDTFNTFGFLYPHYTYAVRIIFDDSPGVIADSKPLGGCMAAGCISPNISMNPASLEPGENGLASFGINIANQTLRNFGEYSVRANPGGGMAGGGTDGRTFNAGTPSSNTTTSYNGPFGVTSNYRGNLTAVLQFNGASIGGIFGAGFNCGSNPYTPSTRPYLQVTKGDISAGGGFKYKNGTAIQCPAPTDSRRFIAPSSGGSDNFGGIRTFANTSSLRGSSADFGAYSMGIISNSGSDPLRAGFNSRAANPSSSRVLSFANVPTVPESGGLLGGTNPSVAMHCATDFFDETQAPDVVNAGGAATIDLNSVNTGQYMYKPSAGQVVRIHGKLTAGKRVTIYVDNSNVLIDGNIDYGDWGFDLTRFTNTSPYLAVITKGNIHVQSNVSRIDGLFIAQPTDDVAVSNGVFSTCSNGTTLPTTGSIVSQCQSQLTINGAVVSQHFYALRSLNTMWNNSGPAESANFVPSTIIGQPNFMPHQTRLEGLQNLPPVF